MIWKISSGNLFAASVFEDGGEGFRELFNDPTFAGRQWPPAVRHGEVSAFLYRRTPHHTK